MNIDIGPNLAGILGSLVAALIPVVVLWLKGSHDAKKASVERADATESIHQKIDASIAPSDRTTGV